MGLECGGRQIHQFAHAGGTGGGIDEIGSGNGTADRPQRRGDRVEAPTHVALDERERRVVVGPEPDPFDQAAEQHGCKRAAHTDQDDATKAHVGH